MHVAELTEKRGKPLVDHVSIDGGDVGARPGDVKDLCSGVQPRPAGGTADVEP